MGALKVFLITGLCLFGLGPQQELETISWSERKLTWEDFKGEPPQSDRVAATTASGISYRFTTLSNTSKHLKVNFEISTHFYPNESWYKPELCDDIILGHEQLHFDITELFARKLRKEFSQATFDHTNIKSKVKSIYNKNNKELSAFQNRYDAETNFSRNRKNQRIWNLKIKEALENQ